MKFKVKYEKSNFVLMTSIILLSIITCILWFILKEYIYFSVYFILTLLISYIYYFTYYYIKKDGLIFRLGFIKIKLKYNNIKKVENLKDKVKIYFNKININIYPKNKDIFVAELNSKLTNKNS